ncbi:MAG: metal ABC transporter substrate-binding protein [Neomegalonema sp.]|nr:metal ABC transporter substrate-binding protein [Neomegalonema sp.]
MRFLRWMLAAALVFTPLAATAKPIKIVASFSILGDMVKVVAGDMAEVTTIVGPDADAHVYTPSVQDARAVAEADVIFVNGLGFETWSKTLIETSGSKAAVFVATEGITPLLVEGEVDPHAWNALPNGVIYVRNIAKGLAKVDPKNAAKYDANAEAYIVKLMALHKETTAALAKLPADRRTVVTAHDAFGYLAKAYGLEFLAPVGIDTEAEPSARDLAKLIKQIKEQKVAALFVENITSPALVEQIAKETGLSIGGRLFSDALSERGGPATSYLAMFRHNLDALVAALSPTS